MTWANKAVADVFLDSAVEQLQKPFSAGDLEPLYTAAAAKTVAAALEWYDFRLNAKLPELNTEPHITALLVSLCTEPKDWTFDFFALVKRRIDYDNAINILKAGRRTLAPVR